METSSCLRLNMTFQQDASHEFISTNHCLLLDCILLPSHRSRGI
ncbi:hypothetical protein RSSM_06282 [Rhodopirellula sallentina SM41]|uniref:Uncharacterized protein n=1 Tax=Rhodopirellula sallentina SM41 TaxID=1263870 RepID=M5TTB6_9BACT|nr:hypothetical protein RSSM_06282 [Rhodopirellula sallentina SM41]